jgi:hypothetical protein
MTTDIIRKQWEVIKSSHWLRTLLMINIAFIIILFILIYFVFVYSGKIAGNNIKIQDNLTKYAALQESVNAGGDSASGEVLTESAEIFSKKSFADFEEVVPFVAYLESLFTPIDPSAELNISSNEDQIYTNRYADYEIRLQNLGDKFKPVYRALNALYDSRFVTNISYFRVLYTPPEDGSKNKFDNLEFTIRLFLK